MRCSLARTGSHSADSRACRKSSVGRLITSTAGHPRGRAVDEDTAYTHLQMAARYLGKMTALAAHFAQQTGSPAAKS
ncbi:hypothetical protein ACQP2T_60740 [Nonomuraea sp. CA-143628]|uniref:hypothetical protein n=1 Tax=Nonomuraea sp. CA-143628 TaxID=3239997 RepID=UPI003D8C5563